MMWQKISFLAPCDVADDLSDFLLENGALSVELLDADAGTPLELPQFDEAGEVPNLWPRVEMASLWECQDDFFAAVKKSDCAFFQKTFPFTVEEVANENWVQKTQAQFAPLQIGPLWIVPSWHDVPQNAQLFLRLDPGMAFGTGTHPTTRLCLEWLLGENLANQSVLDYGTGSGILALAAAKKGAERAVGVDIDPHAVLAAQKNAQANGLANIEFYTAKESFKGQFDVVLANILANPLRLLAPVLCGLLKEKGCLVLSGILVQQAEEIRAIYAPFVDLSVFKTEESWAVLTGRKS